MIAIIAEKPSVARSIADIVGAKTKEDGYLSSNGYKVTWAFGHLVMLAMPEEYGFTGFNREHLPIIPETFKLVPRQVKADKGYKADTGALKQLKIIKQVFDSCDKIIVATDAGREGELIFRFIYSYLKCNKPFDRLWISSLTEKAIKDGLQNLKTGSNYDNLYYAAKSRSEADWLVGINSSQALTVTAGRGIYSLGRVQTPTLAMICKRYLENKNFVPIPFWQIKLNLCKDDTKLAVVSSEKWDNRSSADNVSEQIYNGGLSVVKTIERKTINQEPPLLYDLTTLQKEANSKHGFSADKTLSIAQKLYESGLTTYPRTGSRYISVDIMDEIPELIKSLKKYPRFGTYVEKMDNFTLNIRSVDDKKVTDHHAIIITENQAKDLSGDEKTIYEMIAGRMLEAFSPKCIKEQTAVIFDAGKNEFTVKGTIVKIAGWRNVWGVFTDKEDGDDEQVLPELTEGDEFNIDSAEILEKQTKPKPIHTEATLLSSMESCGKDVENEDEREAMKESGIGTPATRAAIIETLFSRDYIRRDKKSLIPTEKGLAVYEIVKDKRIADVALTGNWENTLAQIEKGEMNPDTFRQATEIYTRQITEELLNTTISVSDETTCACPKCKTGKVVFFPKVAKCMDANCGLVVFRNKSDKQLTDKQITDLLTTGKTSIIKGFKSKAGKSFDAALVFDAEYKVVFDFPEKKKKK
jgi:DNA topoisomerase III, bacteria and conjugative plasmid